LCPNHEQERGEKKEKKKKKGNLPAQPITRKEKKKKSKNANHATAFQVKGGRKKKGGRRTMLVENSQSRDVPKPSRGKTGKKKEVGGVPSSIESNDQFGGEKRMRKGNFQGRSLHQARWGKKEKKDGKKSLRHRKKGRKKGGESCLDESSEAQQWPRKRKGKR